MRRYRGLESWGPPGTGEVALGVAAQVQAQLELIRIDRDWWLGTEIPEVERVDIAVGVDGQEVLHYVVQRDPDLGGAIIEEMRAFWVDHVLKGVPPPIDEKSGTRRRLEHELRQASKRVRPASEEEAALAAELLALDEHIGGLELR
jgi:predicted phage-related endonuclease